MGFADITIICLTHLRYEQLQPPAVEERHLCPEQDSEVLGGIQPHLHLCGGEDLSKDDLGVDVMGKVKGRHHQLHQVTPVLIVANVQQSGVCVCVEERKKEVQSCNYYRTLQYQLSYIHNYT